MLEKLKENARTGLDGSPGDPVAAWAETRIEELERIVQAKCAMLDQISEAAGYKTGEQFSGYGIIERLREQGRQS